MVSFLLEQDAKVNIKMEGNVTHLIRACERGYINIVKLLLERGADVNQVREDTGSSPLHIAIENDSFELVKILCD